MCKPIKPKSMSDAFFEKCLSVKSKRPKTVIDHLLTYGSITTEELSELYGYDHPPRAIRDVRENGIPLETYRVKSPKTGRMIAAYKFGDPSQIIAGRIGGRKAFSKEFKQQLVDYYDSRSTLSNERLEPRYLQIDHRIPYEISGNDSAEKIEEYMLLDASEQRTKSWSCENCKNFKEIKNMNICKECFWAYPENYNHIAMHPQRRLDIVFNNDDIDIYDKMDTLSKENNKSIQILTKEAISLYLKHKS